jgi:hypothetical protein
MLSVLTSRNSDKEKHSGTNGLEKETAKTLLSNKFPLPQSNTMVLIVQVNSIQDTTRQELLEVLKTGTHASALADMSKRKLIEKKKIYYFSVEKGDEFTRDIRKQETDISVEMLQKSTPPPSRTIVDRDMLTAL